MDIASFRAKYSHFENEGEIQAALDDAALLIDNFSIDESKKDLALGYLAAHLLTLPKGETEQKVSRVKADNVEVAFSSGQDSNDWLKSTSYGLLLSLLIKPKFKGVGVFVL